MPSTTQVVPAQRTAPAAATDPCPRLGGLSCQRRDDHVRGHVYHGAWAPDRHDRQD
ncbi:hypothetical protein GCM10028777_36330 [Angustibacter speluncae]